MFLTKVRKVGVKISMSARKANLTVQCSTVQCCAAQHNKMCHTLRFMIFTGVRTIVWPFLCIWVCEKKKQICLKLEVSRKGNANSSTTLLLLDAIPFTSPSTYCLIFTALRTFPAVVDLKNHFVVARDVKTRWMNDLAAQTTLDQQVVIVTFSGAHSAPHTGW